MPVRKGGWTAEDIEKLKSMAGKMPVREIAARLGRTQGATAVEASKLGISLRRPRRERLNGTHHGANVPITS
jgi:hypothetical protein